MKVDPKYIWDYDIKSIDLKNQEVLRWYLSRQINFGNWRTLDTKLVEQNLSRLDIDPTLKRMLKKYYAYKETKNNS
jgi:hypothetical protein